MKCRREAPSYTPWINHTFKKIYIYILYIYLFFILPGYNAACPQSLSFTQGHTAETSELKTHDAIELIQLNSTDWDLNVAFSEIKAGFITFIFDSKAMYWRIIINKLTRNLHLKRCDYAVRAGIQVRLTQTDSHFRTKAVPLDSQLMLQKRAAPKQNTVQCTLCSTKLLYNYYWSNTWMASQLHGSRVRGSILRVCVFHMFSLRVFSGFAGFLQPHKKPKLFLSLSLFFFFLWQY